MNDRRNKIAGALYGVAIGDALGAPLEFMSAEQIRQKHGYVTEMIGGGWLNVAPGETTDDTAMTLAVAEGILENPDDPIPAIGERFIVWVRSGPKDIGGTCSQSIYKAAAMSTEKRPSEEQWFNAAKDTARANRGRSGGNGALMRTIYPGLYYSNRLMAVKIAAAIAQMTHWDKKSTEACELYTSMIYLLTEAVYNSDEYREDCVYQTLRGTQYEPDPDATISPGTQPKPSGYVVDSMKCAVAAFCTTETFEKAVVIAANMGGDTDTIAAITGGLAGAYFGYEAIPERWIRELAPETRAQLDRLVDAAVKNRKEAAK